MTKDDLQKLGERAAACPGWRWMPGMLAHFSGCERSTTGAVRLSAYSAPKVRGDYWPDLSDPATLGWLLALVREAWGEPDLVVERYAGRRWGIDDGGDWVIADTEAEALVAALEAAP